MSAYDVVTGEAIASLPLVPLSRSDVIRPIREFHDRWGDMDADDVDPLALWEDLGRLLDQIEGGEHA